MKKSLTAPSSKITYSDHIINTLKLLNIKYKLNFTRAGLVEEFIELLKDAVYYQHFGSNNNSGSSSPTSSGGSVRKIKDKNMVSKIQNIFRYEKLITEEFLRMFMPYILEYNSFIVKEWSLCRSVELSEAFIEKYINKINWCDVCESQRLSEAFIEKYADKVNWDYISYFQKLSEEFIDKHADKVDWRNISKQQKLSEVFIEKYADKVDWLYISQYQKLSEEFIEKYKYDVYWEYISEWQKLSEAFIEKHADEVDWDKISTYQILSEEFIEKHMHELNLNKLVSSRRCSSYFIQKYNVDVDSLNHLIYKSQEYILSLLRKNNMFKFEIVNDEYVVGYLQVRILNDNIKSGEIYKTTCYCESNGSFASSNDNLNYSTGFTILSKIAARKEKYHYTKIFKVHVDIKDICNYTSCFALKANKVKIISEFI